MSTERNRRRRHRNRKSRRASRRSHRFFTRSRRFRQSRSQRGGTYAFSIPNSAVVYAQPAEDDGFSAPRMMSKEDHKAIAESI